MLYESIIATNGIRILAEIGEMSRQIWVAGPLPTMGMTGAPTGVSYACGKATQRADWVG